MNSGTQFADTVVAVPEAVLDACASGNCVLIAGSGLAAQFGFRTRTSLLRELAKTLLQSEERLRDDILKLPSDSTDLGYSALIEFAGRETVLQAARQHMRYSAQGRFQNVSDRNPKLFRWLSEIPFSHCVTVNLDQSLRAIFAEPKRVTGEPVLLFSEHTRVPERVIAEDRFILAELFGSIAPHNNAESASFGDDDGRVFFTTEEVRRFLLTHRSSLQLLMSALAGQTLLFAGFSQPGIEEFYRAIPEIVPVTADREHFALIPDFPDPKGSGQLRELERELYLRKYGLQTLPFRVERDPSRPAFPVFRPFLRFFEDLHSQLETREHRKLQDERAQTISRVTLHNIGPFADVTLDLVDGSNVVVGGNGLGKSVFLRALALALVGSNAVTTEAAKTLLREGASHGRIELVINKEQYIVDLDRGASTVAMNIGRLPPILEGRTLGIAFPAVRAELPHVATEPMAVGTAVPDVEDVLPIFRVGTDLRSAELKQWLLDIEREYRSPAWGGAVRTHFYGILHELFGGELWFEPPDTTATEIFVKTPDGLFPMSAVSTGVSSVVTMFGHILKRMSEVFPAESEPWQQAAIVIVDHIDANLHPEWQRRVLPALRKLFPRVQLIAATHSPLVVTSADIVFVVDRSGEGSTQIRPASICTRGLSAEELLQAGEVFGVESTRPPGLEEDLLAYEGLARLTNPSRDQREQLEALRQSIGGMLNTGINKPLPDGMLDELLDTLKLVPLPTARERVAQFLKISALPNEGDFEE